MAILKHVTIDGIDYRSKDEIQADLPITKKDFNSFGMLYCHNKRQIELSVIHHFAGNDSYARLCMTTGQAKELKKKLAEFIKYSEQF